MLTIKKKKIKEVDVSKTYQKMNFF